ncbi:MAG: hypothetical protein J6X54_01515 [Treponema sp.]|nr:hypothetical protein [Treponema sp.]
MKRSCLFICCVLFTFTICTKDTLFFNDPIFFESVDFYIDNKINKEIKKEIDELAGSYWIKETPFDRPTMFDNLISQDNIEYIFLSDMKVLQIRKNWSCMYDTKVGNYTISEKLVSILCETECNKINQFQLEFNSTEATLKDGKLIVTNKLNKTKEIYVLTEMFIVKDDPLGYIP